MPALYVDIGTITDLTSTDHSRIRLPISHKALDSEELKKELFNRILEHLLDLYPPGFDWDDLEAVLQWDRQCLEAASMCHIEAFYRPHTGSFEGKHDDILEFIITPPHGQQFALKRLVRIDHEQRDKVLKDFFGAGATGLQRDVAEDIARRYAKERGHQISA